MQLTIDKNLLKPTVFSVSYPFLSFFFLCFLDSSSHWFNLLFDKFSLVPFYTWKISLKYPFFSYFSKPPFCPFFHSTYFSFFYITASLIIILLLWQIHPTTAFGCQTSIHENCSSVVLCRTSQIATSTIIHALQVCHLARIYVESLFCLYALMVVYLIIFPFFDIKEKKQNM